MEIYFNNTSIQAIYDKNNIIYYKGVDIVKILGYRDTKKAIKNYVQPRNKIKYIDFSIANNINIKNKPPNTTLFINTDGLKNLLDRPIRRVENEIILNLIETLNYFNELHNNEILNIIDYQYYHYIYTNNINIETDIASVSDISIATTSDTTNTTTNTTTSNTSNIAIATTFNITNNTTASSSNMSNITNAIESINFNDNEIIGKIIKCFRNDIYKINYNIGDYTIDLYFEYYKIAVENNNDEFRQLEIMRQLNCEFVTFDPNDENFDIFDIINRIHNLMMLRHN